MSAIVGMFALDGGPTDRQTVLRMLHAMSPRASCNQKIWTKDEFGVGAGFFSDGAAAHRDAAFSYDAKTETAVVAHTRLDNREELRSALRLPPSADDCVLLLAGFEKWGESLPTRLLGDFVFVLWQRREQRLFMARDHIGAKAFFYVYQPNKLFAFASEVKALRALPSVRGAIDERAIASHLTFLHLTDDYTFFEGIKKLPAAHQATVAGTLTRRRYWELDRTPTPLRGRFDDVAQQYRHLFDLCVKSRIDEKRTTGVLLSGGLDSSSIACVAAKILGETTGRGAFHGVSALFPSVPESDELEYISAVHRVCPTMRRHFVAVDQISPLSEIDAIQRCIDQPCRGPHTSTFWTLLRTAHQAGVTDLFDGFDGDAVVSLGLFRLAELAARGRWVTLAREVDVFARRLNTSSSYVLRRFALRPWWPGALVRLRDRTPYSTARLDWINSDFARRHQLYDRMREKVDGARIRERSERTEQQRQIDPRRFMHVMEIDSNRGAVFGIQLRRPFCDIRMIEFCMRIPSAYRLRRGWLRAIQRSAHNDLFPHEVSLRPWKKLPDVNFMRALLAYEANIMEDMLIEPSDELRPYVNARALGNRVRQLIARNASPEHFEAVWPALTLSIWLRQFC